MVKVVLRLCNLSLSHQREKSLQECSKGNACALSNYSSVQWENWILCRHKGGMHPCFLQRKGSFGLLPSLCVNTCLCPWWPQQAYLSTASEKTASRSQHPTSSHMHWNLLSQLQSFLLQLHLFLWDRPLHSSPSVWLTGITIYKRVQESQPCCT